MASATKKHKKRDWLDLIDFKTVVLSRSAFLYRNLANTLFPDRLSGSEIEKVRDRIIDATRSVNSTLKEAAVIFKDGSPEFDTAADKLRGYGLLTKSFSEHRAGAALVTGLGSVSVLVNDEDHLTFLTNESAPFSELWLQGESLAQSLEKSLHFASSPIYGFLSANPDHVGTGLRFSCCFCFFGLYLMKELEPVLRGIERLGFEVVPMFVLSENEENPLDAPGCCYRVTSTQTMWREEEIIERMDRLCAELARQERNARIRLIETKPLVLVDFVVRSVAVGSASLQMSESEGLDIAYTLLFAADMNVFDAADVDAIDLRVLAAEITGTALCQAGSDLKAGDVDEIRSVRAAMIRTQALKLLPLCLKRLGRGFQGKQKRGGIPKKAPRKTQKTRQ